MKKCYLSVTDKSICEKSGAAKNQYLYNGKELNTDFGLDWLDFGFRWYDPAIARFPSVDPIIEKFPHLTPYNYASNNPIRNIDLWGLQGLPFNLKEKATAIFNSIFPDVKVEKSTKKTPPLKKYDIDVNVKGNVKVGLGAGLKGNLLGVVKGEVNANIGSVKLAEASVENGAYVIGKDGEVRIDKSGSASISLGDQVKLGGEVKRETTIVDGQVTSDKSKKTVGLKVNGKTYGYSDVNDVKNNKDNSTRFSVGVGGQLILGGEIKAEIIFKEVSTTKKKE